MIGLWLAANAPGRISSLAVCCAALTPVPSRQSRLDRVTDALLAHFAATASAG